MLTIDLVHRVNFCEQLFTKAGNAGDDHLLAYYTVILEEQLLFNENREHWVKVSVHTIVNGHAANES